MGFEWDEGKRAATVLKHGLDFADVTQIFDDFVVEWESPRAGERRTKATGMVEGRYITVIYAWRGERRRIISARAARRNERDWYERAKTAHH